MVEFIIGPSGSGKTTKMFGRIEEKCSAADKLCILVPEQYSHTAERRLAGIPEDGTCDCANPQVDSDAARKVSGRSLVVHTGREYPVDNALQKVVHRNQQGIPSVRNRRRKCIRELNLRGIFPKSGTYCAGTIFICPGPSCSLWRR